jgi:hypothetical protein
MSVEATAAARSVIVCREFVCPTLGHKFSALVRRRKHSVTGEMVQQFQPLSSPGWLALPVCIEHQSVGEPVETYNPSLQTVPERERFVAWLSPDGERLAVPGVSDAAMPARYRQAGYQRVEGYSVRDLDKFDQIRARQTGNIVHNEMNYDAATRRHRTEAEPDMDSDDILKSEI